MLTQTQTPKAPGVGQIALGAVPEALAGRKNSLLLVTPETVVRWHSLGVRLYWAMLSKRRNALDGRKTITCALCARTQALSHPFHFFKSRCLVRWSRATPLAWLYVWARYSREAIRFGITATDFKSDGRGMFTRERIDEAQISRGILKDRVRYRGTGFDVPTHPGLSASMFGRGDRRMLQCGQTPLRLGVVVAWFDAPGGVVVRSWDFDPTLLGSRIAFSPCGPQPCQNIEATAP